MNIAAPWTVFALALPMKVSCSDLKKKKKKSLEDSLSKKSQTHH